MANFLFKKINIPAGGGPNISIDGVDASGEAVGNYGDGSTGIFHGIIAVKNGPTNTYDPPNSSNTDIVGITDAGEIFGDYTDWANRQHGFVDIGGVTTTIDFPFANATTISGATQTGELFGSYVDFLNTVHGFIDNAGIFTQIDVPGAASTSISGISATGEIVGAITYADNSVHGFIDNNGSFTTFDPPGSNFTSVVGVSASGEIVGNYQDSADVQHGFVDINGVISTIDIPGATSTGVTYVSQAGEIVGYYADSTGNVHGFVDNNNGPVITVDAPGAVDTDIEGVNAAGQIFGFYNDSTGQHGLVGLPGPTVTGSNITATTLGQSFAASNLFTYSDPSNQAATEYDFRNAGTGGGYFALNGTPLAAGQDIDITAAQLPQLAYHSGVGTDTLYVQANDGSLWSIWSAPFTVTGAAPSPGDTGPVVTASNVDLGKGQTTPAASSLFQASDPDGDPITEYAFWDTGAGGGHFVVNGVAQGVNHEIDVAAAQLGQVSYQAGSATDTLWVRASDGFLWGAWSPAFTVSPPVDTPPLVTASNVTATHGESFAASSLFNAIDLDGDPITEYDFWNTGGGGGYFALNGTPLGLNQDNFVSAAQLAQVTYQSGAGTDTLWVRASDGTQWSAWSSGFTVTAPIDTGPVVTPASASISAVHGQSFQASSLFTASDPFNDPMTQYDFWDTGAGGGHFALSGQTLALNQDNFVSAAQLAQVTYQSGAGTDTLWVRASDGAQWSAWTSAFTVTAPVDTGPVVTPASANISAAHGQSFQASTLFTASDPFNDPMTQYDFWDSGAGGGHFTLNGQALAANQDNFVSAAQLAQVIYQSGSGADTLWVRASDGTQWSAWTSGFTVTAAIDAGPVVSSVTPGITTVAGQTFAASSLFMASDPFGDAISQYDFWDTGAGGGHFALNGQPLATNQDDVVSASQLAQTTYVAGPGTDTLWVRVAEGGQWSAWSPSFTISDPPTIGAGETLELPSAFSGSLAFTGQTGTLKLDDSPSFTGTVAGLTGNDTIDFADIDCATAQPPAFAGTGEGGILTVSDGIHTANIALLGNYLASSFVTSNDGYGGTLLAEPPASGTDVSAQGASSSPAGTPLVAQVVAPHGS